MATTGNTVHPNDEVNNFKQYPGESLMEAWFRMCEIKKECFYAHAHIHVLRRFYVGLGTWFRVFLDSLTNENFANASPDYASFVLVNLVGKKLALKM